jgi:hypothetical protein
MLDLSSNDVHFPANTLVRLLVLCIVVPLITGICLRELAPSWTRRWQSLFGIGGSLGLYIAVFANIGTAIPHIKEVGLATLGLMVALVLVVNILNYGVAYVAGRASDLDYAEGAALGFAGGMRSNGTAMVVGLKTFPAYPLVTLPAAIYIVSQHLVAGAFLRLVRRQVPWADTVLDHEAMLAELRRLDTRFRRPRRLTLSMVEVSGSGDDTKAARTLAEELRASTSAADLVAVDGAVIAVAFLARHTEPPDLAARAKALWKGPPLELCVAHETTWIGHRSAEDLFLRCAGELRAGPASGSKVAIGALAERAGAA